MSELLVADQGPIRTLTLNRPEFRNAYSESLKDALIVALRDASLDDAVRVLIVTGAGSAFCAGGDLQAMVDRSGMFAGNPPELRDAYIRGLQALTRAFQAFEKPIVAAMNGPAIGAGLGLALNADIRIASKRARMGATFANVGLIPGDGSGYLLSRAIGFSRAMELLLTARVIDSARALEIGLVNEVVEADDLMKRALEVAGEIARLPPTAVKLAKSHLVRTAHLDVETSLHLAAAFQALTQSTDEHIEAAGSLLETLKKS